MSRMQKRVAELGMTLSLFVAAMSGAGCTGNPYGIDGGPVTLTTSVADEPTEWVDFHLESPVDAGGFDPVASGMFGTAAQSGHFLAQQQISQGVYVTSEADPTTIDQVRLTFAFDDGSGTPRTLAVTPASYAVGQIFISTVDAAIAQLQADVATNNAQGEIFDLEYQTTSTQGGTLSFGLKGNQGAYSLVLDVSSPHTSLVPGLIGQAASSGLPYDYVSGTVNFTMSQDEFDYFVGHAYGAGATGGQNFNDFELIPYQWLRLTVTPNLPQNIVNVGFDVTTLAGSSIALAQAPASVMAGGTFQALVDRMMATMTAQEAVKAGSSVPWTIPFYYDQPTGGGVVQVIASGLGGIFSVAYSVASPQHPLLDVPFVAYKSVSFPPPNPDATTPCYLQDAGYTQALNGIFQITFSASTAITAHLTAGQQLIGDIGCSIYYSNDVTVDGPNPGAVSLEDFVVPHANLLASTPPTFTTSTPLADGEYQILCAQYVDGNDNNADEGDPVTLPIGGYTVACGVNPAAVQFAILDPESQ